MIVQRDSYSIIYRADHISKHGKSDCRSLPFARVGASIEARLDHNAQGHMSQTGP